MEIQTINYQKLEKLYNPLQSSNGSCGGGGCSIEEPKKPEKPDYYI